MSPTASLPSDPINPWTEAAQRALLASYFSVHDYINRPPSRYDARLCSLVPLQGDVVSVDDRHGTCRYTAFGDYRNLWGHWGRHGAYIHAPSLATDMFCV